MDPRIINEAYRHREEEAAWETFRRSNPDALIMRIKRVVAIANGAFGCQVEVGHVTVGRLAQDSISIVLISGDLEKFQRLLPNITNDARQADKRLSVAFTERGGPRDILATFKTEGNLRIFFE